MHNLLDKRFPGRVGRFFLFFLFVDPACKIRSQRCASPRADWPLDISDIRYLKILKHLHVQEREAGEGLALLKT